jgi:hypothetical protein
LRKSTAKRIKRRFRKLDSLLKTADLDLDYARGMVASTEGWMKWANTYNFRKSIKLDSVKERIELLMRGIPKVLSSKEDYYYMAENFNEEVWKPLWGNLLFDDYIWIYSGEVEKAGKNTDTVKYETMEEDGKTTILKYEYVENPRSFYKNLGFTKDEIVGKLGA